MKALVNKYKKLKKENLKNKKHKNSLFRKLLAKAYNKAFKRRRKEKLALKNFF